MTQRAPYLQKISVVESRVPDFKTWPFSLPFVKDLELPFTSPVTFFVGENGSGKSTLIEAIADLLGLPVSGGGKNEAPDRHGPERCSPLAPALRPAFTNRPPDSYFFRAEFQAHFASLLDQRSEDPDFTLFGDDPYAAYGGESLHTRSHGEGFLLMLMNRLRPGLFLLDEPESALSPHRQLTLLTRMLQLVEQGATQFIIATHSAMMMTFPGAIIVGFDESSILTPIRLEDTPHYQITKGMLEDPERYWEYLRRAK